MEDAANQLGGTDPIDYDALPFAQAQLVMRTLSSTEADRWSEWYLGAGVVDVQTVAAGGSAALDEIWMGTLRAVSWGWFRPHTWEELVASGAVPLWIRLEPGYLPFLGVAGSWVTAGLVACTCRWMERELGARWVLPADLGGPDGRSEPLIVAPEFRGIAPLSQFVGAVGAAVGLVPGRVNRDPGRLRELIEHHRRSPDELAAAASTVDRGPAAIAEADGAVADIEGPVVEPWDGPSRWVVGFSDVQAHDEDERVDAFTEALGRQPGVDEAFREDREVVVVQTSLDPATLQALAARVWAEVVDQPRP